MEVGEVKDKGWSRGFYTGLCIGILTGLAHCAIAVSYGATCDADLLPCNDVQDGECRTINVSLTWDAVVDAKGYTVWFKQPEETDWEYLDTVRCDAGVCAGVDFAYMVPRVSMLVPGREYQFCVFAFNFNGQSANCSSPAIDPFTGNDTICWPEDYQASPMTPTPPDDTPPGDPPTVGVVGYTTTTIAGTIGKDRLNGMCDSEFSGSHFCTMEEYKGVVQYPSDPTNDAWLDEGGWNCHNWETTRSSALGQVVRFVGGEKRYEAKGCFEPSSVACCR